jgi:hypothetical protein
MKHLLLLPALALACTLTACKKDEEKPKSKTELLTARNWRITADLRTSTSGSQTTTTDAYAAYPPCLKDDYVKYSTNHQVEFNRGALQCANEPQSQTSNWEFNADETRLTISAPPSSVATYEVLELTAETMKLRVSSNNQGVTNTQDVSFAAY